MQPCDRCGERLVISRDLCPRCTPMVKLLKQLDPKLLPWFEDVARVAAERAVAKALALHHARDHDARSRG
jgi:hypothetical protein